MLKKDETVLHFVGIGGIGMSGIAEVFLNHGYQISGSDLAESDNTRRLAELGAKIAVGHRAENVKNANVVVISSAVKKNNPEVLEARRLRIPVIPRAEMLGELMRGKLGIAVAGTHGKTTTTSMLATVLTSAGLDPTLVIGGKVDSLGGNAKLGQGKYVVAEADESDGSFLHIPATYAVVTNVDNDHMDHYGDYHCLENAFIDFVGKIPFYGSALVCADDPGVRKLLDQFVKPFVTYGFSEEWDLYALNLKYEGLGSHFDVWKREGDQKKKLGTVRLRVPGRHNVLNSLATIGIGLQLDIPFEKIVQGLKEFCGVKRRFDIRWQDQERSRAIVDDYGHHPTEVKATLSAARNYWPGRIISVFQPHRYTRTLNCYEGFLSAFEQSDVIVILDIYSAGEDPIPGVHSQKLAEDLLRKAKPHQKVIYASDLKTTQELISNLFTDGDLIICMGAGTITRLPDQLVACMAESFAENG